MEFFTRYRRPKVKGLVCPEHSLTEQVYKEQCDLNFLIRKYRLEDDPFALKAMVDPSSRAMSFIDTTSVPDIYTALREHQRMKLLFEGLDYNLQARFDFSVDAFMHYVLTAPIKDVEALGIESLRFTAPSEPVKVESEAKPKESVSEA